MPAGWRVVRAYYGGSRWAIWYSLVASNGKRAFEVRELNDLKGTASIKSGKEALDFVRLRTSPRTYLAFHKLECEVTPREDFGSSETFGDVEMARRLARDSADGLLGIVDKSILQRAGLPLAKCYVDRQGTFTVVRILLVDRNDTLQLMRVKEQITADGGYTRLTETPMHVDLSVYWQIPNLNNTKETPWVSAD